MIYTASARILLWLCTLVQEIGFANRSPKDVVTMFCQKFIFGTKHR